MQRINREEFLNELELAQPGLATREIIEQSSCFVFKDNRVLTFNDEVACSLKSKLKITGAVRAAPLLSILRKMNEDEVEVEVVGGALRIKGKRREAGVVLEAEVQLPVDRIDVPDKWKPLAPEVVEAIKLAQHCASNDESNFELTCVHLHPKWIEACDSFQLTRVKCKSGISAPTLVRRDALKHIVSLDVNEFAETEAWLHFRNATGLVLSCRRYNETYPDVSALLKFEGKPLTIPKGLKDAADKAAVFSSEAVTSNDVLVELRPGKVRVQGRGASGWYREIKKIVYDGPPIAFSIAPELLMEITEKHNDAEIAEGKLRIRGERWVCIVCLSVPEEDSPEKQDSEDEKEEGDEE